MWKKKNSKELIYGCVIRKIEIVSVNKIEIRRKIVIVL